MMSACHYSICNSLALVHVDDPFGHLDEGVPREEALLVAILDRRRNIRLRRGLPRAARQNALLLTLATVNRVRKTFHGYPARLALIVVRVAPFVLHGGSGPLPT